MTKGRTARRGQAPRLPMLLVLPVVAVLAFAGTAEAADQGGGALTSGGLKGALGLVSQQTSQTAQAAVAQAGAVQVRPVNIAVTVVVNSPGASPVTVQTNGNSAGASAGNSSSTKQSSQQPQTGGGKGSKPSAGNGSRPSSGSKPSGGGAGTGGGQSQPAQQASQTAQSAVAQAGAVQIQPVNIAAPVVVNSPGSNPVIVQTNSNSAGATAANSSSTTQSSVQPQAGGSAAPSQPRTGPGNEPLQSSANPGIDLSVIPGIDWAGIERLAGAGPALNWNWIWNWNPQVHVPVPQLPQPPGWPFPGAGSSSPGGGEPKDKPAGPLERDVVAAGRPSAEREDVVGPAGWSGRELSFGGDSRSRPSSSFVQTPANAQEPALAPLVPLSRPALPTPPAGGVAFTPAGFILGALLTLALNLASLGLLFGRLGLASAPWRHQAYLAPLQRPG